VRIPTSYLQHLLFRGSILWLLARLSAAAVVGGAADFGLMLSFWAVAITTALVLVDLQRRREVMLLNNLGVTTQQAIVVSTIPAVILEVLLGLVR